MKIHDFATMMALYPMTKTEDIAKEFGIPVYKLRRMARICHVKKADDYRSEVARRNGRKKGQGDMGRVIGANYSEIIKVFNTKEKRQGDRSQEPSFPTAQEIVDRV